MTQLSMESAQKFLKSKNGLLAVLITLLLVAGGVYYATRTKAPLAKNDQESTTTKTNDPQTASKSKDSATSDNPQANSSNPKTDTTPTTTPSTSSPATSSTPTLIPADYPDNFTGDWYINFGTMTLTQSGTSVSGSYYNGPQAKTGSISGSVSGQTLTGTWSINGAHGPLILVKGTHTLSGTYNSSFKWCGALAGYQFPADCGFAGHWVAKIASNSTCAMDLMRTNNSVTGTYCNGTVSGTISYPINDTKLSGNWKIGPTTTGPLAFFLSALSASPKQLFFQGNYNTSSYWCGGLTAADQPSTCIKS